MDNKERLLKRFEELEQFAEKVAGTWREGRYGIKYVDAQQCAQWKAEALTLLHQVFPMDAMYTNQLQPFLKETSKGPEFVWLVGVFKAAHEDFKLGMFDRLKLEIEAGVTVDFLDQANALMSDEGNVDYSYVPAAVLVGAVLEKSLRALCIEANPPIEIVLLNGRAKKMSAMIADLKKAKVVNEIQYRQLEAWNTIRNSAAHGKVEDFSKQDVTSMMSGVRDFLAKMMK